MVIEARALTRSCFENLIWLRNLKASGLQFVEKIMEDIAAQRIGFAKALLPNSAFLSKADRKELQQVAIGKGPKALRISDYVNGQDAQQDYLMFRALSDDAVHASGKSLNRHTPMDANGMVSELWVEPPIVPEEAVMTLHFATAALIHSMDVYSEIAPSPNSEVIIETARDLFRATVKATGIDEPTS